MPATGRGGPIRGSRTSACFTFRQATDRDVGLDADEMRDLARPVPDGRDRQAVPERRPVLAVIQNLDQAFATLREGRPDLRYGRRVGLRALQESAVAAQHVPDRIAGHVLEALVDVDQRPIGLSRVGDGDAFGRDVERPVLQRQPIGHISRPASSRRLSCSVAHQRLTPPPHLRTLPAHLGRSDPGDTALRPRDWCRGSRRGGVSGANRLPPPAWQLTPPVGRRVEQCRRDVPE